MLEDAGGSMYEWKLLDTDIYLKKNQVAVGVTKSAGVFSSIKLPTLQNLTICENLRIEIKKRSLKSQSKNKTDEG